MSLLRWFLKSHCSLSLCVSSILSIQAVSASQYSNHALRKRQNDSIIPLPLEDFQVNEPVLTPSGDSDQYGCIRTQVLMEHVFANSYGQPFVGMILQRV